MRSLPVATWAALCLCVGVMVLSRAGARSAVLEGEGQAALEKYQSAAIIDANEAKQAAEAKIWLQVHGGPTTDESFAAYHLATSLRNAAAALRAPAQPKKVHKLFESHARKVHRHMDSIDRSLSPLEGWVPTEISDDLDEGLHYIEAHRHGVPKSQIFPRFAGKTLKDHFWNDAGNLALPLQAV